MAQENFPELLEQFVQQISELINQVASNYCLYLVVEREITTVFEMNLDDMTITLLHRLLIEHWK